jgi:hypothetical protein
MTGFFRRASRVWIVAAAAALIVAGALGTGAAVASAANAVPIKASISGTVSATSATGFALGGAGEASHLGRTAYAGTVTVTDTDPITGVITDTLTETLTAANGDTLTLLCIEVATPVSPGVYEGSDQWQVIGGTGRFEGATGEGTATTHVDLNTGEFSKQITGSISY